MAAGAASGATPCPGPGDKAVPQQVVVRTAQRVVTGVNCPLLEYRIAGADGRIDFLCPVQQVLQFPGAGMPVAGGTTTIAIAPGAYWVSCQTLSVERVSCGAAGIVEVIRADCADENPLR